MNKYQEDLFNRFKTEYEAGTGYIVELRGEVKEAGQDNSVFVTVKTKDSSFWLQVKENENKELIWY